MTLRIDREGYHALGAWDLWRRRRSTGALVGELSNPLDRWRPVGRAGLQIQW